MKLDFCCDRLTSVRQAALNKNLDLAAAMDELAALERAEKPPENIAPAALIDHIISRYHEVHRVQLPERVRVARRVESVHRENPDVPAGLADLLEEIEQALLSHMQAPAIPGVHSTPEFPCLPTI